MANNSDAGPSGLSKKKNMKVPIIGENNILAELFENSGSDLEDLSDSDPEFEPNPSDNDVNMQSSSQSESEENVNLFTLPISNASERDTPYGINRCRNHQTQHRQGRGRQGRVRRSRIRQARGARRPIENRNVSYVEDEEFGWEMNDNVILTIPEYTGIPCINANYNINEEKTPFDIFSIFFDDNIFDLIKIQTNKYARDRIDQERKKGPLKRKSILEKWKNVSNSEIKLFFATIIHMGLLIKPTIKHYWSQSTIYSSKFCKLLGMSRDRFLSILSMLHINNNASYKPHGHPEHDPLHKIRPIHDHLLHLFGDIYTPTENITIDEGICPFRGRIRFRVYIKGKPHKYGIKLYMVCEAESGYCSNFEVYTGSVVTNLEQVVEDRVVDNLVQRLLVPFENKGYCVYFDRFFSSPTLFDLLWAKKTKAVGTVMSNRMEMPKKAFKNCKLRTGEFIFRRRQQLLALKWKDKRDVQILSTIHKAEMLPAPSRRPNEPGRLKPAAILAYNKNKVGVDRSDQLLSYNSFKRKSVKWWKKLFFHIFDLTMVNSQIIYNKSHPNSKKTLLSFYEEICKGLVEQAGININEEDEGHRQAQANDGTLRLVGKNHFPVFIPATENKIEGKVQRNCKVCCERGKYLTGKRGRTDTRYMCEQCQIPLCVVPCFKNFHTLSKYWS